MDPHGSPSRHAGLPQHFLYFWPLPQCRREGRAVSSPTAVAMKLLDAAKDGRLSRGDRSGGEGTAFELSWSDELGLERMGEGVVELRQAGQYQSDSTSCCTACLRWDCAKYGTENSRYADSHASR